MNTIPLLGASIWVFLSVTVVVIGFAAFMTGQASANSWKPAWHAIVYCLLLGFADRFLVFALFEGELFSVTGYVVDTALLIAISLFAFRLTKARKMVNQYPWLYRRAGIFGWRSIESGDDGDRSAF